MSVQRRVVPFPRGSSKRRMPGVEGLRALAASAVLVHHVWIADGGERVGANSGAGTIFLNLALGVTLFFALSGFLLYRPFAAAIARGRALPSIGRYLRNRSLRILPAYLAILLLDGFVLQQAITEMADGERGPGPFTDPVEVVKSVLLIQNYFPDSIIVGIGPAWSLAVEVVFYLVLPLLVVVVASLARNANVRRHRVAWLLGPPLLLLAIGLSGKYAAGVLVPGTPAAGYGSDWHSVIERSFWAQADLFSFGMLAAVLHTEIVDGRITLPRGWRIGTIAMATALFVPCAISLNSGQLSYLPQNTVVALAAALLMVTVVFPSASDRQPLIQRAFDLRAAITVGLVSYSVFLWNEPVIFWLVDHGFMRGGWSGLASNLVLTSVVVGVLSVLTYRFVELPWLQRKRRGSEPMPAAQVEAAP